MHSYAKINFGLKVLFRYPNGYHHINSLFLPIDFSDTIHFSTNANKNITPIIKWVSNLNMYYSDLLLPYFSGNLIDKNILIRSFDWFLSSFNQKLLQKKLITEKERLVANKKISSLSLTITKSIPSPAGLGGGSSNASTFIQYLVNKAFGNSHRQYQNIFSQLQKESMELGADIPFFFLHRPALVTGIGEVKERCFFPALSGILGIPPCGFPTSLVYQALDAPSIKINSPLQNEKPQKASCDSFVDPFRRLINYVCERENSVNIASSQFPVSVLPTEITHEKEGRLVYIKNDLIDAASKVNKSQMDYICHLMLQLAHAINEQTEKNNQKIYYSMSGSGGSFFSMGNFLKNQLNTICNTFQKKYPHIQWKVFSVIGN